ncbi:hypothetical protein F6X68_03215 [Micromonospora sp. AMSO12t]|uniref:hypothetical protein n=1 Tax=unclassified Micromonospora TaxID=2617518 RepID=UPI00124B9742|nr:MULTISPECIES: hypothetical protein [unclassified Micromonospora]KAB1161765.1 hypothetical protein F6X68_03215 [Micromonospora sp. AMSO12t]WSG02105.1 hypothetical protein OG989_31515 [Micromonospora sp. NBC_01740]
MPARRNPKKSRTTVPTPSVADLTPVNLDEVAVAPVVPALPVDRPTAPKAGPPVSGAGRSGPLRGQKAGQARRYAFRRS